jgi:urease accessory protein
VSELRYPEPADDAAGITLTLAAGGSISTWQGARL